MKIKHRNNPKAHEIITETKQELYLIEENGEFYSWEKFSQRYQLYDQPFYIAVIHSNP
jgi:hypothetical protein